MKTLSARLNPSALQIVLERTAGMMDAAESAVRVTMAWSVAPTIHANRGAADAHPTAEENNVARMAVGASAEPALEVRHVAEPAFAKQAVSPIAEENNVARMAVAASAEPVQRPRYAMELESVRSSVIASGFAAQNRRRIAIVMPYAPNTGTAAPMLAITAACANKRKAGWLFKLIEVIHTHTGTSNLLCFYEREKDNETNDHTVICCSDCWTLDGIRTTTRSTAC